MMKQWFLKLPIITYLSGCLCVCVKLLFAKNHLLLNFLKKINIPKKLISLILIFGKHFILKYGQKISNQSHEFPKVCDEKTN